MPTWHAARTRNAERILDCAERLPGLRVPRPGPEFEHAWYKCYVFTEPDQLRPGWDRDRIMNAITSRGVSCYSGICPEVYLEKAFADLGLQPPERLPVAKELGETSLMFLVHPTLTEAEIHKTCAVLEDVMTEAAGS
jgi:dTDP-4-amino-4,6-dideoxygalactose transaminase